jgi:hypothetical protein
LRRLAESRNVPERELVAATELFRFPGLPLIDLSLEGTEISSKNAALIEDATLAEVARDFQTVREACKRGIVSELQLADTDMQPIELEEGKEEAGEQEPDLRFTEESWEEDEEIREKLTEAEVFERYDRTDKAIETLKGVLDKHPGNENARRLLEELYRRVGMDEEAERLEQEV